MSVFEGALAQDTVASAPETQRFAASSSTWSSLAGSPARSSARRTAEMLWYFQNLWAYAIAKSVPLRKTEWKSWFPHLAALIDRLGADGRYDRFELIKLMRWSSGHKPTKTSQSWYNLAISRCQVGAANVPPGYTVPKAPS